MKGRYLSGKVLQELADAWDAYLDDDAEDFDRLAQAVWGVLGRQASAAFVALQEAGSRRIDQLPLGDFDGD